MSFRSKASRAKVPPATAAATRPADDRIKPVSFEIAGSHLTSNSDLTVTLTWTSMDGDLGSVVGERIATYEGDPFIWFGSHVTLLGSGPMCFSVSANDHTVLLFRPFTVGDMLYGESSTHLTSNQEYILRVDPQGNDTFGLTLHATPSMEVISPIRE
jgi:hypothetical protein